MGAEPVDYWEKLMDLQMQPKRAPTAEELRLAGEAMARGVKDTFESKCPEDSEVA